eukprot:m.132501 g.132501  ORF g.132501 m.132501 type:complete len:335 (-) comp16486_c0_seq7:3969-4973(-)
MGLNVWLLGRFFQCEGSTLSPEFETAFANLPWFTYRNGFPSFPGGLCQSDRGWGCMIRCGQMILAECFMRVLETYEACGRDAPSLKRSVLAWFADEPFAPYSIHRITAQGELLGKGVGQWFGPNAIVQVLQALTAQHEECPLAVHVCMDGVLCTEDIETQHADPMRTWKPLLLLIPLRLGLKNINPDLIPAFQEVFSHPYTVGAIGGRPNSAFYFVGTDDNEVYYLDPHSLQSWVRMEGNDVFSLESYSCKEFRSMRFRDADPELCLGFLFKTREEYDRSIAGFKRQQQNGNSLFEVTDRHLAYSATVGEDMVLSGDESILDDEDWVCVDDVSM